MLDSEDRELVVEEVVRVAVSIWLFVCWWIRLVGGRGVSRGWFWGRFGGLVVVVVVIVGKGKGKGVRVGERTVNRSIWLGGGCRGRSLRRRFLGVGRIGRMLWGLGRPLFWGGEVV